MNFKSKILKTSIAISLITASLLAEPIEKVFATVNGNSITQTDMSIALKDQRIDYNNLSDTEKKQLLDQVIQKKLLSKKALNSDITKSDVYTKTLELTIQGLKEELALQIWMQNLSKDITVTPKEVKDYYSNNASLFVVPGKLNANHILLNTKEEAIDIIKTLSTSKNLKDDFIKLAIEKSTGPSGKDGGGLGWFSPSEMVPEFSNALASMKKNSITTTPVQTKFGFHVIYFNDKEANKTVSFDKAKGQIKAVIGQNKFKEKMDTIINNEISKAKIVYK